MTRSVVPEEADGTRLDLFLLRHALPGRTRGDIQRAIRAGTVAIHGKRVIKPSTIVHGGQEITLGELAVRDQDAARAVPKPTALPALKILHEDPALLVIDKPAGVPVHAGVKGEPSIADALLAQYPELEGVGEPGRPGIVHRLDKDTSGVLLIARTPEMYEHVKREFENRKVRKEYRALVHGVVRGEGGTVKLPLARSKRNPLRRTVAWTGEGKAAETTFQVLEHFREHTLLGVFPRTGRMHQIRVHVAHLGFPVAGDALYGRKSRHRTPPGLSRQFLHALAVTVMLPSGKTRTFRSPLPEDLEEVLRALRGAPPSLPEKPLTYRWRTPRRSPSATSAGQVPRGPRR